MTETRIPRVGSRAWEELANQLRRQWCPEVYPCGKCRGPVVTGYVCRWCGDSNPKSKEPRA